MSYNNILPFWLIMMPDPEKDFEKFVKYLNDDSNGIPDHVRERLKEKWKVLTTSD